MEGSKKPNFVIPSLAGKLKHVQAPSGVELTTREE